MKTILLSNKYSKEPLDIVLSALPTNFTLLMLDELSQEELVKKAEVADYILASGRLKIDREVVENATNLKMVQRTGVGLDTLDLTTLKERNIPVYVNSGINAESVAEHTILLILSLLRRLVPINKNIRKGIWKKQEQGVQTRSLRSQTIGIIGMGEIGQCVAKLLKNFGSKVIYYDLHKLDKKKEEELTVEYKDLKGLMNDSDVITLHCPLTATTKHLICEKTISEMKDGVVIINTARGGLIDEKDICFALQHNKVAYAALDVFEEEPVRNKELVSLPNVIATPHIAGITYDSFFQMINAAMRNIELFDNGFLKEIDQYCLKM